MYSLQEVTGRTGIPEKSIRVYMQEGLLKNKGDEFSDEDVIRLKDIFFLRSSGQALKDTIAMINSPLWIPGKPMESQVLIEQDWKKHPKKRNKILSLVYAGLFVIGILIATMVLYNRYGSEVTKGVYIMFLGLGAVLSGIMAIRYLLMPVHGRRMPYQGEGTVTEIVEDHDFSGSYGRAGSSSTAGTREPGIGGIWQFFFLFWYEIRMDCYFPQIEYTDQNGKVRTGILHYGGWKRTWKKGEKIGIAWAEKEPEDLYPTKTRFAAKKFCAYFAPAMLLAFLALMLTI